MEEKKETKCLHCGKDLKKVFCSTCNREHFIGHIEKCVAKTECIEMPTLEELIVGLEQLVFQTRFSHLPL